MADINSDDFRQLLDQIRAQSSILEGIYKNTGGKGPSSNPDLATANKGLRELGKNLRDDNDKLKENNKENTLATRSLKALGAGAKEVGSVLSSMANSSTQVTSDLGVLKPAVRAVATGASAAAKTFGSAAEAVGAAASAFPHIFARVGGLLVSGAGSIVKNLGSELAARAGDAVTWYIDQLTEMSGHYNSLSQSGGLAADGLTGMALKANKMSTSLGALSQLSSQFGGDLALVFGTVERGLTEVAKAAEAMGPETRERFLAMGVTLEEQNEAIAAYSRVHLWNARQERLTFTELSKAAQTYVTESDAFSKLLGISRREMQDRQAAQYSMLKWGAVLESMPKETQQAMTGFMTLMEKQAGPEIVAGLQDIFSGVLGSDAGNRVITLMGHEALEITAGIRKGLIDPLEGGEMLRKLLAERSSELLKGMEATIGGRGTAFDPVYVELRKFANVMAQQNKSLPEQIAEARKEQEVKDEAAKHLASANMELANATRELNEMFIATLPKATGVLKAAATTMSEAVTDFKGVIDKVLVHLGEPPTAPSASAQFTSTSSALGGGSGSFTAAALGAAGGISKVAPKDAAQALGAAGITDPRAQANILAQMQAESGFKPRSENLNYSGKTLFDLYGPNQTRNKVRFKTIEEANALAQQGPEAIGNTIYGGRMGNAANEGFKYRGRGLIQLTGKSNYEKFGRIIGEDLVGNPDLANNPEIAKKIAAAYMKEKEKAGVDLTDIQAVGRAMGFATNDQKNRAALAANFEKQISSGGFRTGGISTGPNAGYMQLLHGTEAVVPLPDGNSIPISVAGPAGTGLGSIGLPRVEIAASSAPINVQIPEIREMNTRMTEQMTAMQMQLSKLSEMIDIMRRGVQVNEKILQATRN